MAETPNPIQEPSTPSPYISVHTIHMCGLLIDVYGLDEVPLTATHISILWLHHPRLCSKLDMRPVACATLAAWNKLVASSSSSAAAGERGMIAAAWDQRNHGERKVSDMANEAWRAGNATHAQDMYGIVAGCVADNQGLIDVVAGYLFLEGRKNVDQHLVLGVSMGGHSAWQLMFADERVEAGVMVIACPDFMHLLKDRAKLSRLPTYKAEDQGASFLGSRDFPPALIEACKKTDPKAIIFGTGSVSKAPKDTAEEVRLRAVFDQHHLRGKRILSCSGTDDKLVPHKVSKPFMDFFTNAANTWYKDGGLVVEDKMYEGVGHTFSCRMIQDAVQFLVGAAREKETTRLAHGPKI